MAITRRSEYGLRAMGLLAEQLPEERLSAGEIARRERIPIKYLEQILADLRQAGLVDSRAGARGGYRLSRPAREIRIGEVVAAVDGPLDAGPSDGPPADGAAGERLWPLWHRLRQAMREVLDGTTLDQLAFTTRPPVQGAPLPAEPPPEEDPAARPWGAWWI